MLNVRADLFRRNCKIAIYALSILLGTISGIYKFNKNKSKLLY